MRFDGVDRHQGGLDLAQRIQKHALIDEGGLTGPGLGGPHIGAAFPAIGEAQRQGDTELGHDIVHDPVRRTDIPGQPSRDGERRIEVRFRHPNPGRRRGQITLGGPQIRPLAHQVHRHTARRSAPEIWQQDRYVVQRRKPGRGLSGQNGEVVPG